MFVNKENQDRNNAHIKTNFTSVLLDVQSEF